MHKTTLTLETVTPLFLHGENRKRLELRPPPFKSLMRYWWRTVQDCDKTLLREEEAKLFGSTKGKAPFSIRILGETDLASAKYKPLPHRSDDLGFREDAYKKGQSFDLYLITKNGSQASAYEQIAKLGFLLGGVGNRSRRGFGSIRETNWNFKNVSNLRQEVLDTLNAVAGTNRFKMAGKILASGRRIHPPPKYPVIRYIYFGNPTPDIDALLRKIGQATQDAKRRNGDYTLGDGNPRMASPVIIRIQKVGNKFIPIVTQLYSIYPKYKPNNFIQKQEDFINAIIT